MSSLIQFPLDLPDVTVLKTERTRAGHLVITVETPLQGTRCRRCGEEIRDVHGYDRRLRLRHLPILEHRVYIEIRPKRYRCPYCPDHPTTTQRCAWYAPNSPHTKAFERRMLRSLMNSTVSPSLPQDQPQTRVGGGGHRGNTRLPCGAGGGLDTAHRPTGTGTGRDCLDQGPPGLCHDGQCSGSGRDTGHLGGATRPLQRDGEGLLWDTLPERLKATVKQVCTDMDEGDIHAAREALPRAQIGVDRFHVAKASRACADTLRKQELKRLKAELPEGEYATLKGTLWLFRKNGADLSAEERETLDRLVAYSPALKAAYTLRELLPEVFDTALSQAQASVYLQGWGHWVEECGLSCFDSFLTTLDHRREEITSSFLDRQTRGFVEGLNTRIKVLKRRCYGLLTPARLFQRLHLDLAGYRLFGCA